MTASGLPILATLTLWWVSTGMILLMDSADRKAMPVILMAATAALAIALWAAKASSADATPAAAYVSFACGLGVWGWQLVVFYCGALIGPRRAPCTPGASTGSRFRQAVAASLYHELACLAGAALLFALTRGEPNQLAFWTYLILWIMHASAKLNLFFGMPNLGEDMLPERVAFLTSFMARKPMNGFFPISVSAGTVAATLLFLQAARPGATPFQFVGLCDARGVDNPRGGRALASCSAVRPRGAVAPVSPGPTFSRGSGAGRARSRCRRQGEGAGRVWVAHASDGGLRRAGNRAPYGFQRRVKMTARQDKDIHFEKAILRLKEERRYRVFIDLERDASRFPTAVWRPGDGEAEREVTIWCSNDYLGMGGHPDVRAAAIAAAERHGGRAPAARGTSPARTIASSNSKASSPIFMARRRRWSSPPAGSQTSPASRRSLP